MLSSERRGECGAGQVDAEPHDVDRHAAPLSRQLDAWYDFDVDVTEVRVGADGIVIGDGEELDAPLARTPRQLAWRQRAIGRGGMAVQISNHRRYDTRDLPRRK